MHVYPLKSRVRKDRPGDSMPIARKLESIANMRKLPNIVPRISILERYGAYMARMLLVALTFCLFSNSAWSQACANIRRFDFRNATIHVGSFDTNKLTNLFNDSRGQALTFRLRNGIALTYDDPTSKAGTPDWQAELVMDREVHPEPSTWMRVIVLEDVHMTGTGTWRYILAFGCDKGRLVQKFQFTSEGVYLKHLDNQTLQLYQAIWLPTDSHADPSSHRQLIYKWYARVHQYRLADSTSGNGTEQAPYD
jgi:hypothetical protein